MFWNSTDLSTCTRGRLFLLNIRTDEPAAVARYWTARKFLAAASKVTNISLPVVIALPL